MSAFVDCIEDAVRGGAITRAQAEEMYTRAKDYERAFTLDQQHSPESAARLGQVEAVKNAKRQARLVRYQTAKQAILNSKNTQAARAHAKGTGAGIASILGRDIRGMAGTTNVDFLHKAIRGEGHRRVAEFISDARSTIVGLRQDKELIENVFLEFHGGRTGDMRAAGFARDWTGVAEYFRQRFNRAGGAIPKRADWGGPRKWDRVRVSGVSKQEWTDFILPRLHEDAMTNSAGAPLSRGERDLLVQDVHDTIRTDGISKMVPGARGGKKLANRRQDHRVLVFKDAATELEVQKRFGSPDLFQSMMDHIDSMAHDIALLEVLGPNPNAGFRHLMDVAAKDGLGDLGKAYNESLFRVVNGHVENSGSVLWLADFTDSVMAWLVAAKLGSAALSAVSDPGFTAMTSALADVPFTKVMNQFLKQLNPANEADRIVATKMGLTAMQAAQSMATANRYSEVRGRGKSGKAAEITLRASGLTATTDAWKRAFGMEFYGNLADHTERAFNDLPEKVRAGLERYDITADMWNEIRATDVFDHKGARFVSVENIMERQDLSIQRREELSGKLSQMVMTETSFAVPEPDARARVFTSGSMFGSGARGSFSGTLGRLAFQFKGFPVSALLLHVYRTANLKGGPMNPFLYGIGITTATTLLGALAIQLKEISRGKNPRDMADLKFWPAALVQGGGYGLAGDFLYADVNRFGGGLSSTLAGPVVDLIDDTAKLTLGQLHNVFRGEDTEFFSEVVDYARRYMPFSSIWYTRALFERGFLDQAQLAVDDEAFTKFRRRERARKRRYNQGYWWKQGELSPRSTPDLAAAFDIED